MLDPELASCIPLMIWFLEENVGMSVRNISEPPLILLFVGTIFLSWVCQPTPCLPEQMIYNALFLDVVTWFQ